MERHIVKDVIVPGWNEQVKEVHDAARHAYLTWRDIGKPRQGDVFTMMKLSRKVNLSLPSENVKGTK